MKQYQKLFSLDNKLAIVTGAYGHLGTAISHALAMNGADVVLIGRNENELKKLANQNKNKFKYHICDVTDEKEFKNIVNQYESVDILINSAYGKQNEPFEKLTKSEWNHALENTLTHYFTCAQAVSPKMLKQQSGVIINIASLYAFLGVDHRIFLDLGNNPPIHYAVSKGGVLQITRYLATLWADKGIRVNSISPGYFPKKKPNIPERPDYIEEITMRTPMKRIGKPEDLMGSVIYLASNASSFVTGQNLIVDGGWSVW